MRHRASRILTSHAGSLPRPDELIDLNRARQAGESNDEAAYQERLRVSVEDVVRRQKNAGVDIVDVMLAVNCQAYCFEAGNVRHEHEWRVWEDIKLPAGKILIPGVVSHATNVVEHPELVADRIERFARLVGRESVIGGSDCGRGGRVHPQLAWAKLDSLAKGAAIATRRLWH
jgi:methionine synthase II (cobalamin-independent)